MDYKEEFGIIVYNDTIIKLTPTENILFAYITSKERVTMQELCNCIYKGKLRIFSKRELYVYITRINKKIKSLGQIKNINNYGYEYIKGDSNE